VSTYIFGLILLPLLLIALLLPSLASASYKPIITLNYPDGDLVIDAKPGAPIGNGSASISLRYRYLGIELSHFNYPQNSPLLSYLQADKAPIYELGLNPNNGSWYNSTRPEQGETLYLSPAQFSQEQVARLATCIRANRFTLKDAFINTMIYSRAYLGLAQMRTRLNAYDGIARLVYADELPYIDVYGIDSLYNLGHLLMVIAHDGTVMLHTNHPDKQQYPDEKVIFGKVLPAEKGSTQARLLLQPVTINEYGKPRVYNAEHVISLNNRQLSKKYLIVMP